MLGALATIALALLSICNAAPFPAPARDGAPTTECRLGLVSLELGDREYSTTSDVLSSADVWLCSPPDSDPDAIDPDAIVLLGEEVDQLSDASSGAIVRLRDDVTSAANASELPDAARHSFGGRAVRLARFADAPGTGGGPRRRLASLGGAAFVDRTRHHGARSVLSVIVGVADAGGGSSASWPKSCTAGAVREAMWGSPVGTVFGVGASPWALRSECTGSHACLFSIADHMRHTSRGAITFEQSRSREVDLGTVGGYPTNFCDWRAIWGAIKTSLASKGLSVDSFDHVVAYVPKHCAIAEGNVAGKFVVANYCPKSGIRETAPSLVTHELGHNVGFGHSGTQGGGAYDDKSSFMGSVQSRYSTTLNMAHRHMFRWLPELPGSVLTDTDVDAPSIDQTQDVFLADANRASLPSGAKWAIEVHDGARSWYASYRGCTGYDSASPTDWCGVVQVSYRDDGNVATFHLANLKAAGEQVTFGASNHITVRTPSAVPNSLPSTGAVRVSLRVLCRELDVIDYCEADDRCRWQPNDDSCRAKRID